MSEPTRLSEKDVAEIRDTADAGHCICKTCTKRIKALLADRDAHLADLTEAREIIETNFAIARCPPEVACKDCERIDAFLERTK